MRNLRIQPLDVPPEPRPEAQRAVEKVRHVLHETADLHGAFDLMGRQLGAAEDQERAAAARVEERPRETVDVDRRPLARRKPVERGVNGRCADEHGW
jgi:hypothetical protein